MKKRDAAGRGRNGAAARRTGAQTVEEGNARAEGGSRLGCLRRWASVFSLLCMQVSSSRPPADMPSGNQVGALGVGLGAEGDCLEGLGWPMGQRWLVRATRWGGQRGGPEIPSRRPHVRLSQSCRPEACMEGEGRGGEGREPSDRV